MWLLVSVLTCVGLRTRDSWVPALPKYASLSMVGVFVNASGLCLSFDLVSFVSSL